MSLNNFFRHHQEELDAGNLHGVSDLKSLSIDDFPPSTSQQSPTSVLPDSYTIISEGSAQGSTVNIVAWTRGSTATLFPPVQSDEDQFADPVEIVDDHCKSLLLHVEDQIAYPFLLFDDYFLHPLQISSESLPELDYSVGGLVTNTAIRDKLTDRIHIVDDQFADPIEDQFTDPDEDQFADADPTIGGDIFLDSVWDCKERSLVIVKDQFVDPVPKEWDLFSGSVSKEEQFGDADEPDLLANSFVIGETPPQCRSRE